MMSDSNKTKCPSCGDTKISLNIETGRLRCHSCRHEIEYEKFEKTVSDVTSLEGIIIGTGAKSIVADSADILTFKCGSCKAEVVVDTSESLQARCHWCRNTLSVNQQIPNGAVPDKVLPFSVTKEAAQAEIEKFVSKRKFFAHPTFKKEFCAENVMGVYLPYMVVDVNAQPVFLGKGEILIREKDWGRTTYYDFDLYDVERDFDLTVENLTIESNTEKLAGNFDRTNNIVNAIKPFDIENSVKWNANFMRGFTSQKRDTNVFDLSGLMEDKVGDIARHQALATIEDYDRGVRWDYEELNVKGKQWKAAYLPIWLYSYQHKEIIHYVAVNGRNLKTMGSVPINWLLLWPCSIVIAIISIIIGGPILSFLDLGDTWVVWLCGLLGFVFMWWIWEKYRNSEARFEHENDANAIMANLKKVDVHIEHIKDSTRSEIMGRNDSDINYDSVGLSHLEEHLKEELEK